MILAILFSSPDDSPMTIQNWARADPGDFVATAVTELDGTSEIATYGPPYNDTPGAGQKVLGVPTPALAGSALPDRHGAGLRPRSAAEHSRQREAKAGAGRVSGRSAEPAVALDGRVHGRRSSRRAIPDGLPVLPPGRYGPVAPMMSSLAGLAQSGGLDGALLTSSQFYQTNYTKPLLFLSGGGFFEVTRRGRSTCSATSGE